MPVFMYFLSFLTKGVRAMNNAIEILAEASIEAQHQIIKNVALIMQQ
jgi:hypothetical protein